MMQKLNRVSGITALVAVACLVAFGSAGDRIVTPASAQLSGGGGTGQAVSLGGCNRCAWNYKVVDTGDPVPMETDIVVFPRGVSGAIRMNSFWPGTATYTIHADCLEIGATGQWNLEPQLFVQYQPDSTGIRFLDGLIVRYHGNPSSVKLALEYRLD